MRMLNQSRACSTYQHQGLIFFHIVSCLSDGDRKLVMKNVLSPAAVQHSCVPQHVHDSQGINTVSWALTPLILFIAPLFPTSTPLSHRYKLTKESSPNRFFCFSLLFNLLQHKNHTSIPSQSSVMLMHSFYRYNKNLDVILPFINVLPFILRIFYLPPQACNLHSNNLSICKCQIPIMFKALRKTLIFPELPRVPKSG